MVLQIDRQRLAERQARLDSARAGLKDGTNGVTFNNGKPAVSSNTAGFLSDLGTTPLTGGEAWPGG